MKISVSDIYISVEINTVVFKINKQQLQKKKKIVQFYSKKNYGKNS